MPTAVQETVKEKPTILDGEFDEEGGRNSFLEALNAWRGDKPVEVVPLEEDATRQGSFLDGEYDAEASRKSFLSALNNWRGEESPVPQMEEADTTTQTVVEKIPVVYEFTPMSYFEKLKTQKLKEGDITPLETELKSIQIKSDPTHKEEAAANNILEWDEEDQKALEEILAKKRASDQHNLSSEPQYEYECIDVTNCEDQILKEAFEVGRIIEYVPSSRMHVLSE